jgi:hypothetical protein
MESFTQWEKRLDKCIASNGEFHTVGKKIGQVYCFQWRVSHSGKKDWTSVLPPMESFTQWEKRLGNCIASNGEYFEGD